MHIPIMGSQSLEQDGAVVDENISNPFLDFSTAPITVSCKYCKQIVGDSSSWIKAIHEMSAVAFEHLSNIVVGDEYKMVKVGHWDELSTYREIICQDCSTVIGKQYVATPNKLSHIQNKYVLDIETLSLYTHGSQSTSIPAPDSKEIISLFHPHPEAIAETLSNIQRVCIIIDDHSREIDTEIKDLKMMKEEHDSHSTKLRNLDALCHSIVELQSKMIEELQNKALLSTNINPILPNGSLTNQIRTARQLPSPTIQLLSQLHVLPPSSKPISRIPNSSDFTFHDPSASRIRPPSNTIFQEPQFPVEPSTEPSASQEQILKIHPTTDDIVPKTFQKAVSVDSDLQSNDLKKRGRTKRKADEIEPGGFDKLPVKRKPGRPSNRSRATTVDGHISEVNKSRESTANLRETPIPKAPIINIDKPDATFKAIISSPSQVKNSGSILDNFFENRHTPSEGDPNDSNLSRGRKLYRSAHHSK